MSASATVRQRTNKPKKDKKIDVAYMNNFDDADTIDHKPADEAFIFFRPKKSKKWKNKYCDFSIIYLSYSYVDQVNRIKSSKTWV